MNEHFHNNFLLLLYSCVIQVFCLKTIHIAFSFLPILDGKGLLKTDMNMLIQCSTLLVITLNKFSPAER